MTFAQIKAYLDRHHLVLAVRLDGKFGGWKASVVDSQGRKWAVTTVKVDTAIQRVLEEHGKSSSKNHGRY